MNTIKFPIQVNSINMEDMQLSNMIGSISAKPGSFVSIRPCAEEYKDKTYLGLYIGDIAISSMATYHPKSKELEISYMMKNPAIFVFDLKKIIFGCESWWKTIESENDLKEITNQDIENVWYVQLLKKLDKVKKKGRKNARRKN